MRSGVQLGVHDTHIRQSDVVDQKLTAQFEGIKLFLMIKDLDTHGDGHTRQL